MHSVINLKSLNLFCNTSVSFIEKMLRLKLSYVLCLILIFYVTVDKCSFSPGKENFRAAPTSAQSLSCSIRRDLSSDLQVWSSWESNEEPEPQLTLQEEVFTFSSQPHSPKRGQGHGDQEKMEIGDDQVQNKSRRRHEAQPEDDFIGSESDEVSFLLEGDTSTM